MVVFEMLRGKAPAGLILAIVLLTSNSRVPQRLDVEFVECFAGDGEVSLALWGAGLKGSSHDLRYSNLMDFCTPHGFACLGFNYIMLCICAGKEPKVLLHAVAVSKQLRLVLNELWNAKPGAMCLFAICCNSFTRMLLGQFCPVTIPLNHQLACATHSCFDFNSGHPTLLAAMSGMIIWATKVIPLSRLETYCVHDCACACARGLRFLVEQPENSSLRHHPRFQQLLMLVRVPWCAY